MPWHDEWHDKIDFYNHLVDTGRKEDEQGPDLLCFGFYIEDFWELNTTRGEGRPISYFDILRYSQIKKYDFEEFLYIIRILDKVFLNHMDKKSKKEQGNSSNGRQSNKNNPNRGGHQKRSRG